MGAWEYFNEINPGLPTDRFYTEMGEYLEKIDPYHHLRTTSTWHPKPSDWRHPKLDICEPHYYLRPAEKKKTRDEVEAIIQQSKYLRQHDPKGMELLGEFGLADDQFRITEEIRRSELIDFHNALWASSLSGTSGTALFWWWERLDQHNCYPIYGALTRYLAGIPWTTAGLEPISATVSSDKIRLLGLQGKNQAYLWLFNPQASWENVVVKKQTPQTITNVEVVVKDLAPGKYRVQWWDTQAGKVSKETSIAVSGPTLRLVVPAFDRDIACKIIQ